MRTMPAIIAAVMVAQFAGAGDAVVEKPAIEFDVTVHDFGTIMQYTSNEFTFAFKNAGNGTLKIERTQATCGCTAVAPSEEPIAAGKTGELKVTFNSQDFSGPVHKFITVYSNDPDKPEVRLELKASILADLVCTPMQLNFGEIGRKSEQKELQVKLFSPSGRKFKVLHAKPSLAYLKAEVVSLPADANQPEGPVYLIKVSIDGTPPAGGFTGSILVQTDIEKAKPITVTVMGTVHARTEVTPPKVFFGVVCLGEMPTRELIVRANQWEGLKVEKVDAPPALSILAEEAVLGKEWRVAVTFKGPAPEGLYKEKIMIHLNDDEMKQVEVTVFAMVRNCQKEK